MGYGEIKLCYVVDDDGDFRNSLIALLSAAGYLCHGWATASDFLEDANSYPPGVLLLDLRMPQMTGLDLIERHAAVLSRFATVVISGRGDIGCAVRSMKAGAFDFLEKPFASDDLLNLVKLAHHDLSRRSSESADHHEALTKIAKLSPRESQVLRLLLAGAPNKIVARTLDLSVRTVEMHRAHMLAKLSARSTAEAIHMAMVGGITPWPLPGDLRY